MVSGNDKKLQREIQALIDKTNGLKDYGIKVQVQEGEVHLMGLVDTLHERRQLHELVSRVPGIRSIENGVAISTDGQINDGEVTAEVYEELKNNRVNLKNIGAESIGGTVYLRGRAASQAEIQNAMEAASRARGVRDVISQVSLSAGPDAGDLTLRDLFHSQVNNDREDPNFKDGLYE
ncbi:BON domain-containing protein [Desulforamulus hydrothermalis]|uniref:Transport-associated protein n=1 Tax=Desulforamulus hydrothermalis Lam5 = DSM 18033 TaxID=1121428 RepID=K8DXQ1_9FIRM|nr:BON domain-containing protein [Desulforamulus hydrothermalis]CCO07487.1 Transport-associated protein [Desulforamulus hydrothermalis Lam5 = DSM 18033]SHH17387.1 hyperosmotically inducible protein [Desulforamulus hydrothermalis Lam5 = DSM 18033]